MRLFIGCSSRNEIPIEFLDLATLVSKKLKKCEVIIGGTKEGMMGNVVSELDNNQVTQIILKDYLEEGSEETNQLLICDTSFERMKKIWDMSDIFLFLPGGTGTLGEIITFLEENRLKEKKKPVIVLNYKNYFADVIAFIEKAKKLQFSNETILESINFMETIDEVEEYILKEVNNEIF